MIIIELIDEMLGQHIGHSVSRSVILNSKIQQAILEVLRNANDLESGRLILKMVKNEK